MIEVAHWTELRDIKANVDMLDWKREIDPIRCTGFQWPRVLW